MLWSEMDTDEIFQHGPHPTPPHKGSYDSAPEEDARRNMALLPDLRFAKKIQKTEFLCETSWCLDLAHAFVLTGYPKPNQFWGWIQFINSALRIYSDFPGQNVAVEHLK